MGSSMLFLVNVETVIKSKFLKGIRLEKHLKLKGMLFLELC